jgi:mRNA interferase RelE/StbE
MYIRLQKTFLKELANVPQKKREIIEKFVFEEITNFKSLHEIPGIIKLKGYKNYYRIRFGDYRTGLKFENNTLTFERLIHRKDIYKFYP